MSFLLNSGQPWVGRAVRALRPGNRPPVALPDTLSLPQDSGATQVIVLGNDFDPEGGTLSVIAASADLGTVAINPDNTLSYTPPGGYTGPATVTYTIQDDQGLTRSAAVAITVSAPQLSITVEADNTLTVTADPGLIDITVTQPAGFAGTRQADTSDLATGPVNLVPPVISGTPDPGQVLSAANGLWIYDRGAGTPVQSWQWRRDGADIATETGASYTAVAGDSATAITVVETMTDAFGSRGATSAAVGSVFAPSGDAQLIGWWDASDAATITASGTTVSSWADKAGGAALTQTAAPQMPETGVRLLNGLNVLDFDGGRLLEAARTFPASGDVAFHMALEIDSISNLYEAVLAVKATNDLQIDAGSSLQFDGRINPVGIGAITNLTGGPFSGGMILSVILDMTGAGTIEVFIADVSRGSTGYSAPLDATAALHIMTNRSKNAWVNGAVAEVVVTGDVTNRAQYQAYLSAKWGIT